MFRGALRLGAYSVIPGHLDVRALSVQRLTERPLPPGPLDIPGYTPSSMKIAVSIPDPLFEAAEQLARRRKLSRSQLYATALEQLLAAEDDSEITARLDAVYSSSSSAPREERATRRVITVRESW
jgi:hypothetical protein